MAAEPPSFVAATSRWRPRLRRLQPWWLRLPLTPFRERLADIKAQLKRLRRGRGNVTPEAVAALRAALASVKEQLAASGVAVPDVGAADAKRARSTTGERLLLKSGPLHAHPASVRLSRSYYEKAMQATDPLLREGYLRLHYEEGKS